MSHVHTLIRNAVALSLTGLATTGQNVFPSRIDALESAELPGLRVYLGPESVEPSTIHAPRVQERTVVLLVECCAAAVSSVDEVCDQIQLEVEKALANGITVDGQVVEVFLQSSNFEDVVGDVGIKRLAFDVTFFTLATAPDSLI